MNRSRDMYRWVAFAIVGPTAACGSETATEVPSESAPDARGSAPALLSGAPAGTLDKLRSRHSPLHSARPKLFAKQLKGVTQRTLPPSRARFDETPLGLRPQFTNWASATRAELLLPHTAAGEFHVRDSGSGVSIAAALHGARPVTATTADGLLVYAAATQEGATWIQRASETGTEDFIAFDRRPEEPAVRYRLRLAEGVAGLRLVANTLEVVDSAGTPRLRVAPPSLRRADGANVPAGIAVHGCAVDTDPSAPWDRPPVAPGSRECDLSVTWDDANVQYPALFDPTWTTTGALATARAGATAVTLGNGRVLAVGGFKEDGSCLDSAEIYNPSTRTWAATESMQSDRCGHSATRRANGHVLVAGGLTSSGEPTPTTELYDPVSGTWSSGQPLAAPRYAHEAALLSSGEVLVAGGSVSFAEKLSVASSTWARAGTHGPNLSDHTLTPLRDGRVLLVGGAQPQLYDPRTNGWLPLRGSHASHRSGHTATRLQDGKVLIVGYNAPSTELYDPTSGTFSRVGAATALRYNHTATLLTDGRVLLAGGVNWDAAAVGAELYNPTWGTVAPTPVAPTLRLAHVDALLPSGRVVLAGGIDASTGILLASSEEFDPRSAATTTTEYKLPASVDPAILSDRTTELWASVTRPLTLPAGKRPLLVFLHGNHGTCGTGSNPRSDWSCEYTQSGTCPAGYVVTPNHRGYEYVASELAARGYVVVSINANRGINCAGGTAEDPGLNLARGRLILKHLQTLSEWNRGVTPTPASIGVNLAGRLDFSQVGIMGHSRGGEGARAAYQQYRDPGSPWPGRIVAPLTIRAIFEIGPVDGQTSRVLNAEGTTWNVLLPVCDGDVSDLQGVKPFDRMIALSSRTSGGFKSTYTVWGANHNFYNTEWQESDSSGCTDHRPIFPNVGIDARAGEQRQTGLRSMYDFFAANVGAKPATELNDLFNPEKFVPFESPVERGYTPGEAPSDSRLLEDFLSATGVSSYGVKNVHSGLSVSHGLLPEHDERLRGATIRWSGGGANTYFQTNFAQVGSGLDLTPQDLLDFRIGRAQDRLNVEPSTSLSVHLVNANNSVSDPIPVDAFSSPIVGPVGGAWGNPHQMLQTVRIPLSSFGADLSAVRGVRFVFESTPTGVIYLANVRATRSTLVGTSFGVASSGPGARSSAAATSGTLATPGSPPNQARRRVVTGNAASLRSAAGEKVEFVLTSGTPFLARAELIVLEIGATRSVVASYPNGNLKKIVFSLEKAQFDKLSNGAPLRVHYEGADGTEWDFGALDKSRLNR